MGWLFRPNGAPAILISVSGRLTAPYGAADRESKEGCFLPILICKEPVIPLEA